MAYAFGPSVLASGAVAYNCVKAACDLLASSLAFVFPLCWACNGCATKISVAPKRMPANAVAFIPLLLSAANSVRGFRRDRSIEGRVHDESLRGVCDEIERVTIGSITGSPLAFRSAGPSSDTVGAHVELPPGAAA